LDKTFKDTYAAEGAVLILSLRNGVNIPRLEGTGFGWNSIMGVFGKGDEHSYTRSLGI
jgi:hypothetical protein